MGLEFGGYMHTTTPFLTILEAVFSYNSMVRALFLALSLARCWYGKQRMPNKIARTSKDKGHEHAGEHWLGNKVGDATWAYLCITVGLNIHV